VTPIIVDVAHDGFCLTDAAGGVDFDISASGSLRRIGWTCAGADDAWLVLDRNRNGIIDDGSELFGSSAAQPTPPPGSLPNGFEALAVFDAPRNGGFQDGVINRRDAVFGLLRLWRDANHDGVSDSSELRKLRASNLTAVGLKYRESKRTDEFGNVFRYWVWAWDANGHRQKRVWDVFLTSTSAGQSLLSRR
jgi:hypothetical protein